MGGENLGDNDEAVDFRRDEALEVGAAQVDGDVSISTVAEAKLRLACRRRASSSSSSLDDVRALCDAAAAVS